jgi:SAM-dependent methyltransferase
MMRRRLAASWPFSIETGVIRAYTGALGRHGATPQGVFWNSAASQNARFAALLAMIRAHRAETGTAGRLPLIADIGCGYGALYGYMRSRSDFAGWGYVGLDISPAMIRACQQRFASEAARFHLGATPRQPVDHALFSGTFNLCMIDDALRWQRYILDQLSACLPYCRQGMVLNLLCRRQRVITNNIFYADRQEIVAELRQRFGDVRIAETPGVKHDTTFLIPA